MQHLIDSFMNRAHEAGLTDKQAQAFVRKNFNQASEKKANLHDIVTEITKAASVEQTSSSTAYVHGVLKQAVDRGLDVGVASQLAVTALQANPSFKKVAVQIDQEKLAAYSGEFMKAAQEGNFSVGQGIDLLNYIIKQSGLPAMPAGEVANEYASMLGGATSNPAEAAEADWMRKHIAALSSQATDPQAGFSPEMHNPPAMPAGEVADEYRSMLEGGSDGAAPENQSALMALLAKLKNLDPKLLALLGGGALAGGAAGYYMGKDNGDKRKGLAAGAGADMYKTLPQ